jgi:hypothetical protein
LVGGSVSAIDLMVESAPPGVDFLLWPPGWILIRAC